MKRFSFFLSLAIGIFAAAFSLQSCQKEQMQVVNPSVPNNPAGDRAPLIYGVSVFSANNPSQLSTLDAGTGNILNTVPVFIFNSTGQQVFLNDLKGVCVVSDQVFVTTGFNAVDAYSNMLLKVDPTTGQGGVISYSTVGTVSDIDYDELSGNIYGLANNSNNLVSIANAGNNWNIYTAVGGIQGLATYRAKGLSMVRDVQGDRIVIAATLTTGGNTRLFSVPPMAGFATFLGTVNPINALAAGHCGIGFDINLNSVVINRNANAGFGLNIFPWMNPLPAASNSVFWGGAGVNFEDLSSDLN